MNWFRHNSISTEVQLEKDTNVVVVVKDFKSFGSICLCYNVLWGVIINNFSHFKLVTLVGISESESSSRPHLSVFPVQVRMGNLSH